MGSLYPMGYTAAEQGHNVYPMGNGTHDYKFHLEIFTLHHIQISCVTSITPMSKVAYVWVHNNESHGFYLLSYVKHAIHC